MTVAAAPDPGPGPWEQSCREEQADLDAVALVAAMTPQRRQQAAKVLAAVDRSTAYQEGRGRLAPQIDDAWSPPRWQQADAVTGGPEPRTPVVRLPSGSLLDHIAPGNVLDPVPPRRRFSRARCDVCGCWVSERSARAPGDGWLYCGTCNRVSGASP